MIFIDLISRQNWWESSQEVSGHFVTLIYIQITCNSHQTASHHIYRQSKRANRIAKQVNAGDEKRGYGAEEMFVNIDRKDRGLKTSYFPYSTVPLKMKYSTFLAEKQTKEKR